MKKIKFLALAFAAMFIVACSSSETADGNPAIDAAEEFIANPTMENSNAVDAALKKLNDEEKKEFKKWCEEHEAELMTAAKKME